MQAVAYVPVTTHAGRACGDQCCWAGLQHVASGRADCQSTPCTRPAPSPGLHAKPASPPLHPSAAAACARAARRTHARAQQTVNVLHERCTKLEGERREMLHKLEELRRERAALARRADEVVSTYLPSCRPACRVLSKTSNTYIPICTYVMSYVKSVGMYEYKFLCT